MAADTGAGTVVAVVADTEGVAVGTAAADFVEGPDIAVAADGKFAAAVVAGRLVAVAAVLH